MQKLCGVAVHKHSKSDPVLSAAGEQKITQTALSVNTKKKVEQAYNVLKVSVPK